MADPVSRLSAVLVTPRPATRTPAPAVTKRYVPPPPPEPLPAGVGARVKAGADFALATAMAVALLPVLLACMALVRLTSTGPAIYTQKRVGRGGRVFTLYKIRTMFNDCESLTGPQWSTPGDPRITPVGRVLRKLHLDELPQLWNVLRGDMSLVGPRPERPEIVKNLRQVIVGYDRRHRVKPGITGFAQVHLPPDSCVRSVKNKLVYDLYYIRHRTARMELFILFATALKMCGLKKLYQRKPRFPTEE